MTYYRITRLFAFSSSVATFSVVLLESADRVSKNPNDLDIPRILRESAENQYHYLAAIIKGEGSYRRLGGSLYSGQVSRFVPNGQGTQQWSDGTRYEGGWQEGLKHGQGTQQWPDGDRYEGRWHEDLRHGQGTYQWSNGTRYEGGWQEGLKHGQGSYQWSNGTRYEGGWQEDLKHGQGSYQWLDGTRYEGLWFRGWPGTYKENPYLFTFDLENDPKMVENLPTPKQMSRTAVIFQSTEDRNGAFKPFEKNCELLSDALLKAGYKSSVHHFSGSEQLRKQMETELDPAQEVDLVWLRAHGRGKTFKCGPSGWFSSGEGDIDTLSPLSQRLSKESTIVLESCNLGKKGMLAEQLRDRLCKSGLNPIIFASNGESAFLGIDLKKLKEKGSFDVAMVNQQGENIVKVYKCPL